MHELEKLEKIWTHPLTAGQGRMTSQNIIEKNVNYEIVSQVPLNSVSSKKILFVRAIETIQGGKLKANGGLKEDF